MGGSITKGHLQREQQMLHQTTTASGNMQMQEQGIAGVNAAGLRHSIVKEK